MLQVTRSLASRAPVSFTWLPNTSYVAGQLVVNGGQPYTSVDAHISGATFAGDQAAHWTLVVPGMELTSVPLSTTFAIPAVVGDVTDAGAGGAVWQAVCPANMGPIRVGIASVLLQIHTGTNASGTAFAERLRILDEANTQIGALQYRVCSSLATNQDWIESKSGFFDLPNNASQKTYRVQALLTNVGTASCTGSILATPATDVISPILSIARR